MKRFFPLIIILSSACSLYAQQDAQQSQYMFNGIYINPAYAGYKETLNLHAYYRDQWTGIAGAPKSFAVAIDASANDGNVGLALQIANDKLGAQSTQSIYGNYAYRIRINDNEASRLALGFGVGVSQTAINFGLLDPNDPEPTLPVGIQSTFVPDARVGAYFSNDKYYLGLSADNLVGQYIESKSLDLPITKPHIYLTGGYLFPLSEDVLIKPSFLIKDDRGGPTSLDMNTFILLGQKLWVGGSYRTGIKLYNKPYLQTDLSALNAGVLGFEFFPSETLRIGYNYDFSVGSLHAYSGGTHEISIGFTFPTKSSRMLTPRYF